ncbi:MAG: transglycosylase SLT domain-containing protein [Myxococcota bacterium]
MSPRARLALVLLGVLAAPGCRNDGNLPAAQLPADTPPQSPDTAAEPELEAEAPSDADNDGGDRELWFASGPGRSAIVARERRDHDAAREALDRLLADESLSADDRGAAELLRALEHQKQGQDAEAADRFAAARKAPGLESVAVWLVRWEAQARLDAGQPEVARSLLEGLDRKVWTASAVGGDLLVIEGDAHRRTKDPDGAEKAYRQYLADHKKGDRRFEVRAKLARMLVEDDDDERRREGLTLYDGLRTAVPLSDYGQEAKKTIPKLERELGPLRKGGAAASHRRELSVLRAEALLDRHRYASAVKAVDGVKSKSKLSAAQRCRLWYVKGSSIFKQRKRAEARDAFDRADRDCKAAGKKFETLRVKSRYQGARGWYAAGQYSKAGERFEALASDHGEHSYADDALVLAGESWESHGNEARAAKAYVRAIEKHPGDKRHEARRRLLVMHFAGGKHKQALALIDAALKGSIAHPAERAKLLYFRGRALDHLGRPEDAEQAWLEAVEAAPLDYPSLQALSRLRERGPELLTQGLDRLRGAPAEPSAPAAAGDDALHRADVLARLGLGTEARAELRHAEVKGWPAVAVLNQAGLYPAAQREIANLGARWRADAPGAGNLDRWRGAYPQPFTEIIGVGETTHEVPSLLTFAIMQTESRFDPGVTSFAGARGLVQLMPATARGLAKSAGVSIDNERVLFDPALNLDLGMRYLGRLTARYGGGNGAVALAIPSYNAGAGSVDRWLGERGKWDLDLFIESIPYDETRKYTQSVLGRWLAYRWLYGEGDAEERVPFLPLTTPSKV